MEREWKKDSGRILEAVRPEIRSDCPWANFGLCVFRLKNTTRVSQSVIGGHAPLSWLTVRQATPLSLVLQAQKICFFHWGWQVEKLVFLQWDFQTQRPRLLPWRWQPRLCGIHFWNFLLRNSLSCGRFTCVWLSRDVLSPTICFCHFLLPLVDDAVAVMTGEDIGSISSCHSFC